MISQYYRNKQYIFPCGMFNLDADVFLYIFIGKFPPIFALEKRFDQRNVFKPKRLILHGPISYAASG